MTNDEVVPFGKYKGQPVEALAADRDYCDWLCAQPWFTTKYRDVYNIIIINYGSEPQDSPEHNQMQACFLKDTWCLGLAEAAGLTLIDRQIHDRFFETRGWDVVYTAIADYDGYRHVKCEDLRRIETRHWRRLPVCAAPSQKLSVRRLADLPLCCCPPALIRARHLGSGAQDVRGIVHPSDSRGRNHRCADGVLVRSRSRRPRPADRAQADQLKAEARHRFGEHRQHRPRLALIGVVGESVCANHRFDLTGDPTGSTGGFGVDDDPAFGLGLARLPPDAAAAAPQRHPHRRRRHPGLGADRGQAGPRSARSRIRATTSSVSLNGPAGPRLPGTSPATPSSANPAATATACRG